MAENGADQSRTLSVSIARQPVFDEKQRLWGYTLVCLGDCGPLCSVDLESDGVAVNVAASAYMGLQRTVDNGKKVMVSFSEKSLLQYLPYALPPELTVIQVPAEIYAKPAVPDALIQLKSDGYELAVEGINPRADLRALYTMADVITLDIQGMTRPLLASVVAQAQEHPASLLAFHVDDGAQFVMCRELDIKLFHGAFFKKPDTIEIRKLTSNEVARFNLLGQLEMENPDFNQLAESVQADAAISFRLLAYLNSAAFGLRQKIKSIHQAISLLGWRKMKNWLRVVLLNDMCQKAESSELMAVAAQRGKFLELVARDHDFWGFDPEMLHLLGIFSLLDAMLNLPMTEIVNYLPLDDKLKAALCREPNNEYLPLLELAALYEESRWEEARQVMQNLNLNPSKVQAAFQASVDWAEEAAVLNAS